MAANIGSTAAGKETEASPRPAPEALDGALVLFPGVPVGDAHLELVGRGGLPLRRKITVGPHPVTLVRQPIVALGSATLIVTWSTEGDLPALDRSIGSCQQPAPPARFEVTVFSCPPARPGRKIDAGPCQPFRTEPPNQPCTFGTSTYQQYP